MAILKTYDLKGNKLSFANWISNLSPAETPFTSMISKESVDQTMYSWQVDRLASPDNTGQNEGSLFVPGLLSPTVVKNNFTQILRKVVRITDTANKIGLYGRASEKAYQMEKAGKEIRRDLEMCVLTQVDAVPGSATVARQFAGFPGLVAQEGLACGDTGAIVHKTFTYDSSADEPAFTKKEIFDITYNLYLAGSKANKIMIHPVHMILFAGMIQGGGGTFRLFDGLEEKYNLYVNKIRDPLGQEFTIIPNRFMPKSKVYFFTESDWSQMILRAPETRELARNGSSERHMIEMEVGLRHRNPFASGILNLRDSSTKDGLHVVAWVSHPDIYGGSGPGTPKQTTLNLSVYKDGVLDATQAGTVKISCDSATAFTGVTDTPADGTGTWSGGVWKKTNDLRATANPGQYVVTLEHDSGLKSSVVVNIHSHDRMLSGPITLEEQIAEHVEAVKASEPEVKVAKARKAK